MLPRAPAFIFVFTMSMTLRICSVHTVETWTEWAEQVSCDGTTHLNVRSRYCNAFSDASNGGKLCACTPAADNAECLEPAKVLSTNVPICPGNFIQWLIPEKGIRATNPLLAAKRNTTISSCQEFCLTTNGCKSANFHDDGLCEIMAGSETATQHQSSTLLTYKCCQKVSGEWSAWSVYSPCDLQTGMMTRQRRCLSQQSTKEDASCSGHALETKNCRVNGSWSMWSDYSECSNQTGMQIRTRQCDNPMPSNGGLPCSGDAVETRICGGGSFKTLPRRDQRLLPHFISRKKTVTSREECVKLCLNKIINPNCEVFQIEYESTTPKQFRCRTSTIRAMYLPTFAKRYFALDPDYEENEPGNTFYETYYLHVASEYQSQASPILFYALDDISKNKNLGSLSSTKYAMDMGKTPAHFECNFGLGQFNFLTLIPSDGFYVSIPEVASIPFNATSNFTVALWLKKRVPDAPIGPIIEGTSKGKTVGEWLIWNYDTKTKIHPSFARNKALTSDSLNARAWNYVVMRVAGDLMELYVNNQLEGSVSVAGAPRGLGDFISIGRRVGTPSNWGGASSNLFDGCIGHLMLFTRALSHKEIIQYGRIALDSHF